MKCEMWNAQSEKTSLDFELVVEKAHASGVKPHNLNSAATWVCHNFRSHFSVRCDFSWVDKTENDFYKLLEPRFFPPQNFPRDFPFCQLSKARPRLGKIQQQVPRVLSFFFCLFVLEQLHTKTIPRSSILRELNLILQTLPGNVRSFQGFLDGESGMQSVLIHRLLWWLRCYVTHLNTVVLWLA